MNKKELFEKNLRLSYEFDKYVIEHLEFLAQIPDQAEIVFLPAGDAELCRENRKIAKGLVARGGKVFFAHIGKISPPRLMNVKHYSRPTTIKIPGSVWTSFSNPK